MNKERLIKYIQEHGRLSRISHTPWLPLGAVGLFVDGSSVSAVCVDCEEHCERRVLTEANCLEWLELVGVAA